LVPGRDASDAGRCGRHAACSGIVGTVGGKFNCALTPRHRDFGAGPGKRIRDLIEFQATWEDLPSALPSRLAQE